MPTKIAGLTGGDSKVVKFTIRQRLNVKQIIRQERPPEDDEIYLLRDIMNKIKVQDVERTAYQIQVMGQMIFDDKAIRNASTVIEPEFNLPEIRKLKTLLRKFRPNVDDLEWREPLLEQLEEIR